LRDISSNRGISFTKGAFGSQTNVILYLNNRFHKKAPPEVQQGISAFKRAKNYYVHFLGAGFYIS